MTHIFNEPLGCPLRFTKYAIACTIPIIYMYVCTVLVLVIANPTIILKTLYVTQMQ